VLEIPLTQGFVSLIDDEDWDIVGDFKWSAKPNGNMVYAVRGKMKNYQLKMILMHRQIMLYYHPDKEIFDIDHKDRNGLNNQKDNLRFCTDVTNQQNKIGKSNTSSEYKGVSLKKSTRRWSATITVRRVQLHLGYFDTEVLAARAYDEAAKEHFGEFARCNF